MAVGKWSVRVAILAAMAGALLAQPNQGDKEIGVAGSLVFHNGSPFSGSFFADLTGGKYFRDNQYLGAYVLPQINFASGGNVGSFGFGGEYEYGFKANDKKLWPFIGGAAGGVVSRSAGGGTSNWGGAFQLIPEAGVKYFMDQKTSLEMVVQVPIQFGSGGTTSNTQFLFGLRHIL